ncbi:hypothetical protein BC940DRAFT_287368 [Gongronella butleri]|nr:hypothetical protein BC940DRAFT_287368 [Gongronella butleri]
MNGAPHESISRIPLYKPDELTFHRLSEMDGSDLSDDPLSLSQPSSRSTSSRSSTIMAPGAADQQPQQANLASAMAIDDDLRSLLVRYEAHPELLQLILQSKVQEDARRFAEAQLSAKRLDYLILERTKEIGAFTSQSMGPPPNLSAVHSPNITATSSSSSSSPPMATAAASIHHSHPLQHSSHPHPSQDMFQLATNGFQDACDAYAMIPDLTMPISTLSPGPSVHAMSSSSSSVSAPTAVALAPSSSLVGGSVRAIAPAAYAASRTKKRREMQAISKIVETRDAGYNDGYFWRNNGNTIQKRTGNKSVYYKCSNSAKGCPVNKTVTWRDDGQYLIKYRGEHLTECEKVQHIVDV